MNKRNMLELLKLYKRKWIKTVKSIATKYGLHPNTIYTYKGMGANYYLNKYKWV